MWSNETQLLVQLQVVLMGGHSTKQHYLRYEPGVRRTRRLIVSIEVAKALAERCQKGEDHGGYEA